MSLQVTEFENQVGGHSFSRGDSGILKYDHMILKQLQTQGRGYIFFYILHEGLSKESEVYFYETIETLCPEILRFIPKFYGVCTVEYNGSLRKCMRLEDLTENYTSPCLVDLKIGTRTWDDSASQEKRMRQEKKYPLQKVLGFRFTGIRVFNNQLNKFDVYDRTYGYSLNESTLQEGFRHFFEDIDNKDLDIVIDSLLEQLSDLLEVFRRSHFRYICSSILISYEGSKIQQQKILNSCNSDIENKILKKYNIAVHLVDFAHVKQLEAGEVDVGCIKGIERIISEIKNLKTSL